MSGMIKPKQYKIAETNLANFGTDIEKNCKKAAANLEKQWHNAGKKEGLEIWRIEQFKVVPVGPENYGSFFSGDSYIVLHTYKKRDDKSKKDALAWDIHFWLGTETTQDEAGTAAYKTVELDDFLSGAPVQYREVEGHESKRFLDNFTSRGGIRILEGGVATGFRQVKAQEYRPRLLWIKGRRNVRVQEVKLAAASLNSGDVFVLDGGLQLYQFNGKTAGAMEKNRGASLCRAIDSERSGKASVTVYNEGDKDMDPFWKLLGGEGPIAPASNVSGDEDWEKESTKKLYRLNESADGKLTFKLEATGKIEKSKLDSKDVFILDAGPEVYAWIGSGASAAERAHALSYAQRYLTENGRPVWLPISRMRQGQENSVFLSYLA